MVCVSSIVWQNLSPVQLPCQVIFNVCEIGSFQSVSLPVMLVKQQSEAGVRLAVVGLSCTVCIY